MKSRENRKGRRHRVKEFCRKQYRPQDWVKGFNYERLFRKGEGKRGEGGYGGKTRAAKPGTVKLPGNLQKTTLSSRCGWPVGGF